MSDIHTVGLDLFSFSDNGMRKPVSRITLYVNNEDDQVYTAGDDTGLELSATCIYATEEMAKTLLSMAKGAQYQMYEAQAANLDPAAELGDGIEVGGITSVIAQINDNGDGYPDVSASGEQEVEDEYPGASRQGPIQRELSRARSLISKTNDRISFEIYGEDGKGGLSGKMNTVIMSLNGVAGTIQNYETTVAEYKEEVNKYSVEVDGFRSSIERYISEVDGYKEETAKYEATLEGLRGEITKYSEDVTGYTEQNAKYTAAVEGFNATLGKYEQDVTGYKETVGEYTLKLDEYSGKLSEYEATVDGYTGRVNEFKGTVDGFDRTVKQYSEDVKGYSEQYSTISQRVDSLYMEVVYDSGIVSIQLKAGDEALGEPGTINMTGLVTFTALENGPDEDKGQTVIDGGWLYGQKISSAIFTGGEYWDSEEVGCLDLAFDKIEIDGNEVGPFPWLTYSGINDDDETVPLLEIMPLTKSFGWVNLSLGGHPVFSVNNGTLILTDLWESAKINATYTAVFA